MPPEDEEKRAEEELLREAEEEKYRKMEREIRSRMVRYNRQLALIPDRIIEIFKPAMSALHDLNEIVADYVREVYGVVPSKNPLECTFCRGTGKVNLWKPIEGIKSKAKEIPCILVERECPVCRGTGID